MLYSVQFLRFIAASLVVFYHAIEFLDAKAAVGSDRLHYLAEFGASGVHVFFVISGFVMLWSMGPGVSDLDPRTFWRRRFARIYPSYWLIAALSIPVAILLASPLPDSAAVWFGAILLMPYGAPAVLPVAWTLAYEVYFYLVFGLALFWTRRASWLFAGLAAFFLLSIAIGLFLPPGGGVLAYVKVATNGLLLEFLAGMAIALWVMSGPRVPVFAGWLACLLALAGFGAGLSLGYDSVPRVISWGVPSTLLVFGAVTLEKAGVRLPRREEIKRLGDASYATYLLHAALLPLVVFLLPVGVIGGDAGLWLASVPLYLLSLAAADVYYARVERHLTGMANRVLSARRRQRAPA